MGNRTLNNTWKYALIIILWNSLCSGLVAQSDFYTSISKSNQTFDHNSRYKHNDFPEYIDINIGDQMNAKLINFYKNDQRFKIKELRLSQSEAAYSVKGDALSGLLNSNNSIKKLTLTSDDDEENMQTLIDLDYQNLLYIDHISINWNEQVDYTPLFKKLDNLSKLKNLSISSRNNIKIEVSPSLHILLNKITGLHLKNITINSSSKELRSKSLHSLSIENGKSDSESVKNLLLYFAKSKNIEELIFDRSITTDFEILDILRTYKKLKILDLNCIAFNEGSVPFEKVKSFPKIESLCLLNAEYCSFEYINKLNTLKHLEFVSKNNKLVIPKGVFDLNKLESLTYLSDVISPDISKLKKLKKLRIQGTFKSLPESFYSLNNLIHLDIANATLDSFVDRLGAFKKLETLKLIISTNKSFLVNISSLKNLKELDFNSISAIKTLPNEIGNLKNLESLSIKNTHLNYIPTSFAKLKNLKKLTLEGTPPYDYRDTKKITFLKRDSFYTSLFNSLSQLNELENLNLSHTRFNENNIEKLLASINPDVLRNLYLDLSYCWINELPENIWEGLEFGFLDLSYNMIKKIPNSFLKSDIDQFDIRENETIVNMRYQNRLQMTYTSLLEGRISPKDVKNKEQFIDYLVLLIGKNQSNQGDFQLALKIDSIYTINAFSTMSRANYHYSKKEYSESIKLYKSVKSEFISTSKEHSKLMYNYIDKNWLRYAINLFMLGDKAGYQSNVKEILEFTNKIIEAREEECDCQARQLLLSEDRVMLAIMLKSFDPETAAKILAPKITQMESFVASGRSGTSEYLELLELYLIDENYSAFDSLYIVTMLSKSKNASDEVILDYLKIANDVASGINRNKSIERLKNTMLARKSIYTEWTTIYVEMWAMFNKNSNISAIKELNRVIQPSLDFLPIP